MLASRCSSASSRSTSRSSASWPSPPRGTPSRARSPTGRCSPIFSEIFGLEPDTDGSSGLWLVEAWLGDHAPLLIDRLPLVGAVTSFGIADNEETGALQGKLRADETQAVLVEILQEATGGVPTMLLLEDAHWFDSATWAVLERVLAELPNVSIAVAAAAHPDGRGNIAARARSSPGTRCGARTRSARAGRRRALAEGELAVDDLPAEIAGYLVDRSAGNPFYVLELTRALRDTGGVEVVDRVCRITDPSGNLPAALAPGGPAGRRRDPHRPALGPAVARAKGRERARAGLLARPARRRPPRPEHRASLRDDLDAVASLNLLRTAAGRRRLLLVQPRADTRRRLLPAAHEPAPRPARSVAERLERDAEAANPATVAYHWTMSTRAGGDAETAGAMTRWALHAAVMHLRENAPARVGGHARELARGPRGRAGRPGARIARAPAPVLRAMPLTLTGGWASPQVIETYQRAQELCDAIDPGAEFFPTLVGVFTFLLVSGPAGGGLRMALANDEIARGSGDAAIQAEGAHDRVTSSFYTGRLADTVAGWDAVEASYRDKDHPLHTQMYGKDPYATELGHTAMALALMGRSDEALRRAREALDHTTDFVHPFSNVWAMTILAIVHELRDEPAEMGPIADEMVACASSTASRGSPRRWPGAAGRVPGPARCRMVSPTSSRGSRSGR